MTTAGVMGPSRFAVFAASLLLGIAGCALVGGGRQSFDAGRHPVTVEAVGFASMDVGKPREEVHREALLNAVGNAVLQAHVLVDAEVRVKDFEFAEQKVRTRAAGYVERLDVLEAGLLPQ